MTKNSVVYFLTRSV